jgi:regulator of cell morphogenesis and NO signaling
MKTMTRQTVRELVLENPAATRVLEQLGIDYCCGGNKPLDEACAAANLPVEEVLARLETQAGTPGQAAQKDWQTESLTSLVEHINGAHHVFVRQEVPRIAALLEKVCGVHGANHPELLRVREIFGALGEELGTHLMKEERILFPYIAGLEQQQSQGGAAPASCFGSVQNPIRMMMFEHDNAGHALRELRQATSDYAIPGDACISYQTLYRALQGFEADLHQHIHLENNILFPRTLALEEL